MQTRSRLLAVGSITLLVGILAFFPARVAYQWFAPDTISIAGISGSIWSGQAREARVSGIYLRDLRWQFRPFSLFSAKLGYAVAARPSSGFVDAIVAVGPTGTITLTDVKASLPLQALRRAVELPELRGKLNLQFERIKLDGNVPVAADGVLEVADLTVPLVYRSSIGGYRAEFFTQESGVMASVEDTDGVIDLAGSLQLSSDRSYQFIAQLAAKSNTPASVRQQLQFLPNGNKPGQHELRLEGQL
ncbi:MAG: type II secretion system protein N [Gammaproteobacteria bacterium]|nr:type II secretion system protein N [Gammaproteobacteria bacterium]MDH3373812.1 type II secretion system protein N [Gammaproteobacteria bacterium]MDH3408487.1 type II secretion system protein N [Gammaproteobacteria bacterium]MDH3553234.1 type II secretion system protein N [Gammaproteobacteria bacterium]